MMTTKTDEQLPQLRQELWLPAAKSNLSALLNVDQKQPQPNYLPTPNEEEDEEREQIKKPFVCNQCDQSFSRAHNLKSHLATHSNEKPYQCDTCHHFFRRQHDLKRHQKLHTGERPHVCQNCGRSFARLDALSRHQRAETAANGGNTTSSPPPNKITTVSTTPPPQTNRPMIPQLNIPNPASSKLPPLLTSPNAPITLPSPDHLLLPLQEQVKMLQKENHSLKQELQALHFDKARIHDLQVENNLLKSLIQIGRSPYAEEDQSRAKKMRTNSS